MIDFKRFHEDEPIKPKKSLAKRLKKLFKNEKVSSDLRSEAWNRGLLID